MRLALPVRTELRPICDVPARARLAASVSSSQPPLRHEFVGLQSKRAGRKEASAKRRARSVAVAPFRARGRVQLPQVEHITRITDPSLARPAASCSLGALPAAQVARSAGFRAPVASTQPRSFFEKKRILGLTSKMDDNFRHEWINTSTFIGEWRRRSKRQRSGCSNTNLPS